MTSAAVSFGGHPVVSTLAAVDGILDSVADASLWSLSDDQVASLTAEVARLQARWAAVKLALVAEADGRGVAGRVGAASTQAWLRGVTRCSPGVAKREVALARSLSRDLDVTREALADGRVSQAQASVIAEAMAELPGEVAGPVARPLTAVPDGASPDSMASDSAASDSAASGGAASGDAPSGGEASNGVPSDGVPSGGEASDGAASGRAASVGAVSGNSAVDCLAAGVRARAERQLVQWASQFDPAQLGKLGRRIADVVDPQAAEACEARRLAEWEKRAYRRRELAFADDGRGTVFVRGRMNAASAAVIRRAIDPLAKPRPTDAHAPDDRSAGARMADALVEVCDRALRFGDLPAQGGERPQVVVTVDYDQLRRKVGAGALDTGEGLSPGAVRRLACDAQVLPVVLGGGSVPLDLGRTQRLFTAAQRRALITRDRGCSFPGCDRPPMWCQAHHVAHWIDGGASDVSNGVLLCGHHHRVIHQGHWKVRIADDGLPEFTPPSYVDPEQRPVRNHMHIHARRRKRRPG